MVITKRSVIAFRTLRRVNDGMKDYEGSMASTIGAQRSVRNNVYLIRNVFLRATATVKKRLTSYTNTSSLHKLPNRRDQDYEDMTGAIDEYTNNTCLRSNHS